MSINDPYTELREALANVHFDIQEQMHELTLTDPAHNWSTDPDMLDLKLRLNVFEYMAKTMEELLFPRVEEDEA